MFPSFIWYMLFAMLFKVSDEENIIKVYIFDISLIMFFISATCSFVKLVGISYIAITSALVHIARAKASKYLS